MAPMPLPRGSGPGSAEVSLERNGYTSCRSGFGVWVAGFRFWDLGFGVWSLGFGVWRLGFGAQGLGFRVESERERGRAGERGSRVQGFGV